MKCDTKKPERKMTRRAKATAKKRAMFKKEALSEGEKAVLPR